MVGYAFSREITDSHFVGCPLDAAYFYIVSWDAGEYLTLSEMMEKMGSILGFSSPRHYKPFEAVTNISVSEFYDTYKQSETEACIVTEKDIWLPGN